MTDKEKIRKEVERLMVELTQEKKKGYSSDVDDACILELQNVLTYIDSLQEEPVSENLEEAASQYPSIICQISPQWKSEVENVFKAGAEWQKEQMMKDAVNATIDYPLIGCDFPNIYPNYKELKDYCDKNSIKDEDKVKIIIIKEE